MTLDFGDIVLVDFPFSGGYGAKKRPAVVLSQSIFNEAKQDLVLIAVTSQVENLKVAEILVRFWKEAGLFKPSAIKSVIFTLERQQVYKKLGSLQPVDVESLKFVIKQIFGKHV